LQFRPTMGDSKNSQCETCEPVATAAFFVPVASAVAL
jgi:hypothetical protein